MSIGFTKSEPPLLYSEDVVWRLRKTDPRTGLMKIASGAVRILDDGYELRVYVGDSLLASHLHQHGGLIGLRAQSAQYRADFERRGWTLDFEPETAS